MAAAVTLALVVATALLAWLLPVTFDRWRRYLDRLLHAPIGFGAWTAALAAATFAGQAAVGALVGLPEPQLHDEFSYLLAADTFARGRLTNPTHPLWWHFETFHVLLQPTYASKYPPAQGLVLALGERLGHPIVGVWLSGALFVAAAAWMLAGWLRPPWARLGALLAAGSLVVASPWSHGYSRGFVAAAGGALLFGAAARLRAPSWRGRHTPRSFVSLAVTPLPTDRANAASGGDSADARTLRRRVGADAAARTGIAVRRSQPRTRDGIALAAGLLVLATSRPWEGLVASIVALVPVLLDTLRNRDHRRRLVRRALPATALLLAAGFAWIGWYQWRVTGSPWTMPYRLYDQRYASVPLFLWQQPRAVEPSPHPVIARFFRDFEGAEWRRQHTLRGWLAAAGEKSWRLLSFYFGGALTVALAGLPWAFRWPGPRWAGAGVLALLASQLVVLPSRVHYVAPGACLAIYLVVEGWRHLRVWRRAHPSPSSRQLGARLAATVPLVVLLALTVRAWELRADPDEWYLQRAALQRRLLAMPDRQLVIVRYGAGHDPRAEWVYDDADLFGTRVLWARAMSPAEDCRLLAFERERRAWLLEVVEDASPPRLLPYPRAACTGGSTADSPTAAPNATRLSTTRQGSVSSRRSASG
jgi:hypothetical protein